MDTDLSMTPVTRQEVLGLYRKIFRIAKNWQSASGQIEETIKEKQYIRSEARTLFRKNKNLYDAPCNMMPCNMMNRLVLFFMEISVVYMCIVFLLRKYHVWVKTSL
ncbi:LYR motif-containing protein 1 isoform X2 [Nothoprocta perdicaria]|uniref:LYR motif-containing protein 1 isoform X2 n=1 Tax=Nothoprocta perdicaria TaxID=30464 RepID=UPI000E1BEA4E|nr:LYR motif-containing protein 1 isoform X2 [Nothoprocta perdicaria]